MPARATISVPRRRIPVEIQPANPAPVRSRTIRLATSRGVSAAPAALKVEPVIEPIVAEIPAAAEPQHAGAQWREHDLLIRRFQQAGLTPAEIAVVLHSKGLRVRTWHVSETFVRGRLKALQMTPNASRVWYGQHENCYRRKLPE